MDDIFDRPAGVVSIVAVFGLYAAVIVLSFAFSVLGGAFGIVGILRFIFGLLLLVGVYGLWSSTMWAYHLFVFLVVFMAGFGPISFYINSGSILVLVLNLLATVPTLAYLMIEQPLNRTEQ